MSRVKAESYIPSHSQCAPGVAPEHAKTVMQSAKGREGSLFEGNGRGLWKFRDQQARHASYFGVDGVTGSRTSHPIAHTNVGHTFPNAYHHACTAVPQRQRLVQTAADRLHGREQAVAADLA